MPCYWLPTDSDLVRGDEASDALLRAAEACSREALVGQPVEELAPVATWRAAYRGFGAKPQRTLNSLEGLLRRAESGLRRVNHLTDVYNAAPWCTRSRWVGRT